MNVLEIMDVIICAIILMVHSIAIVIQAICYIQMEQLAQSLIISCVCVINLQISMSVLLTMVDVNSPVQT